MVWRRTYWRGCRFIQPLLPSLAFCILKSNFAHLHSSCVCYWEKTTSKQLTPGWVQAYPKTFPMPFSEQLPPSVMLRQVRRQGKPQLSYTWGLADCPELPRNPSKSKVTQSHLILLASLSCLLRLKGPMDSYKSQSIKSRQAFKAALHLLSSFR